MTRCRFSLTTVLLFAAFAVPSLRVHAQEGLRPFNTIQPMTGMVSLPVCVEPGAKVEYRITMQDYDMYQSIAHPSMLVQVLDEYVLPVPQTIHSMKPGYTLRFLGFDKANLATWVVSGTAMNRPGIYSDIWLLTNPNPNPSMADPTFCVAQIVFVNTEAINAPISKQIMSLMPKKEDAPEVFRPSQAQKDIAAQGIAILLPFRTIQNDQSDAFKAELRKALTKEQRDRLAKNEVVDIDVTSLSAPLQKKAKEYIRNTIENQSAYSGGITFDAKQAYTLVLRPETGLNIGVKAPNLGGSFDYF